MKKEKVLQAISDYENLKEEILKTAKRLHEFDSKKYSSIDDVEDFEIEELKGEDHICAKSEEYHVGCGDYEYDYTEFPIRYLWEDFEDEVLGEKEVRRRLEKEKAEKEAEEKRIAKEERETKQLKDMLEKISKNEKIKNAVIKKLKEDENRRS